MNRRDFLTRTMTGATALMAGGVLRPGLGWAQQTGSAQPIRLAVARRTIEVNGRAAEVFGLLQPNGIHGVTLDAGKAFDVELVNEIEDPTLIHWHGLTPPWEADGVPDNPLPQLASANRHRYSFPVGRGGTHWMHAHTLQEQNLLAAPLIVRTAEDRARDEQEVVILLHDFSFVPAEELLAQLQRGTGHGAGHGAAMNHSTMEGMPAMDHSAMGHMPTHGMTDSPTAGMDLNDIDYDAYLANDRTLDDPEVVRVERGGRLRLRIINGATATGFTIDTGIVEGTLIAVDGQDVEPIVGTNFPISMGQRLDILLTLPAGEGAYPVLALREGAVERTGVILATPEATVRRIGSSGETAGPIVGSALEKRLRAGVPLSARQPDRQFSLSLTGQMEGYAWAIEGGDDLRVGQDERIEITMRNSSMMSHPMHLHGHHFQVISIDGARLSGAVRDTVLVPPGSTMTIAFDADNPGKWPFHCHHLYHMATGMMSYVIYEDMR
ncbi:Multicopper oxidase with three cupredoxin domains (includes cell division protein FtsP and spore coat protein CotA) [Celeribacter indicus]|uniref:Twin-arginine translocation pathway signal n=2 Tax=Celeribacter indicus TaxID=1208324 RepID=A0A0B5E0M3_9RHOB|nr:twin-arginine translocation pathway signal [Celeribacter indicus]SDW38152.1 Multicopper oxidase with three cupredoxin domains (includes cell division protein FtsP and spore coat protein CotA) [Celeribacter indicus]